MHSKYQPAYGIVGAFLAIMLLVLGASFLGAARTGARQTEPLAPTPTINPTLTLDLRVDDPTKFGDPNTTVRFTFNVTNNRCPGNQVYIRVSRWPFAVAAPGAISVPAGTTAAFDVQLRLPGYVAVGQEFEAVVQVVCAANTNASDAEIVLTVVTSNGATMTPSITRTPYVTRTPTRTPIRGPYHRALPFVADNTIPPTPTPTWDPYPFPTDKPECDSSYPDFCIPPPPPDLDCDSPELDFQTDFTVLPPDPHNFDPDENGIGCESF